MTLTAADRRRGGLTTWERYGRIPPGRKRLPRLSAETEMAGRPRGGSWWRTSASSALARAESHKTSITEGRGSDSSARASGDEPRQEGPNHV